MSKMVLSFLKDRPVIAVPLLMIILSFLMSPGVILTIPPGEKCGLFSRETGFIPAFVHAIIFTLTFSLLKWLIFRS